MVTKWLEEGRPWDDTRYFAGDDQVIVDVQDNVDVTEEQVGVELAEWDHLIVKDYQMQFEMQQMEQQLVVSEQGSNLYNDEEHK